MRRPLLLLLTLALAGEAPAARALQTPPPEDPHARALALVEEERWAEAFDAWEAAWDTLRDEDRYDPRLGVAYLREAVGQSAWSRYDAATRMYLWGFTDPDPVRFRGEVLDEARRIAPLLDGEARAGWEARVAEGDVRALALDVKRFWIERDPTPETPVNERLTEHWERILQARQRFVNGRYSPYGTDDRGVAWVKYGPPDEKASGTMGARDDELRIWVRDREQREALRRFDLSPAWELWKYDDLDPAGPRWFLFGQRGGSGRFGRLDGVRDLISASAMGASSRRTTPGGVKAGYYLQLFYYAELAVMGGPWGERFAELDRMWGRAESRSIMLDGGSRVPPEGQLEAMDLRFAMEDRDAAASRPDPPVATALDGNEAMAVAAWGIRTLAGDDEPRLTVVALSSPWVGVEDADAVARATSGPTTWRVDPGLVVRDGDLAEVGRLPPTRASPDGDVSVFTLRHVPEPLHLTVVAPVLGGGAPYPGRMHLRPGPPLGTHPDSLEMSDVVVGTAPWGTGEGVVPFPVMPSEAVWAGDPLSVYLEAYRLPRGPSGAHPFTVRFRVRAVDAEGRPVDGPGTVRVSLTMESPGPTARRALDLDVGRLPLGRYHLEVVVADGVRGQERMRTARFEVVGRDG